MRPAKFVPWVNWLLLTIQLVQLWAELSSLSDSVSAGSPREVRCWFARQNTATRMAASEAAVAGTSASWQPAEAELAGPGEDAALACWAAWEAPAVLWWCLRW